jgi:hypothetical protein
MKGFVHEVLCRSRTSGSILQTALCYLEAIRAKVPLARHPGRGTLGPLGKRSWLNASGNGLLLDTIHVNPISFEVNSSFLEPGLNADKVSLHKPKPGSASSSIALTVLFSHHLFLHPNLCKIAVTRIVHGLWGRIHASTRVDAHLLRAAGFEGIQERHSTCCCQLLWICCEVLGSSRCPFRILHLQVQERQSCVCSMVAIAIITETCGPFTCIPAVLNEYWTTELNVRTTHLEALTFVFKYIGPQSAYYYNSVVTMLEDALTDHDLVHHQTASIIVKHIALGVVGMGCEDSLMHLMNLVWPNW